MQQSHLLFIDHFQIWLKCKPQDINVVIDHLNAEINFIHKWFIEHCLKLNASKTQAIIIGSASNVILAHSFNYTPLVLNPIASRGSCRVHWFV